MDADARHRFEREVRPLLVERCFACHGPEAEKLKGGLLMSGQASLLVGGESGPALVPGDPDASRLVRAVRYEGGLEMPPKAKLPPHEIAVLERWVAEGGHWPGGADAVEVGGEGIDVEAGRAWWSFRPVTRPEAPDVGRDVAPIDAFVLAHLDAAGIPANPRADRRELARRAFFDLIGLPPSPEELAAFEADARPDAFARLVDELLARPEYGQRWGRHWLDVVRYAETVGYERDEFKPYAWRYRDYVVDAFNSDKPYDRFLLEQLAGDELEPATDEALVATGFYRLGTWDSEPDDKQQALFDELDDVVRTISEGVLGVTVGCARCHDHKFDPFPQEDYYSMLAFVSGVRPYALTKFSLESATMRPLGLDDASLKRWHLGRERRGALLEYEEGQLLALGERLVMAGLVEQAPRETRQAWFTPEERRNPRQQALVQSLGKPNRPAIVGALPDDDRRRMYELRGELESLDSDFKGELEWALAVREYRETPPTHVLVRGRASAPGAQVEPRYPGVLCETDARAVPRVPEVPRSSGRRLALADWILAEDNPLTARVMVNRIWQHHFGRGLVTTPNDFGRMGEEPSHPELLDWLASEFVRGGWSIKAMHRLILGSDAYQRSSRRPAAAEALDPDNLLLWRQELRRLDAEALRDSLLAVSGELDPRLGGESFFPRVNRAVLAGASKPGDGWYLSDADERRRRSLYGFVKRNMLAPMWETFDYTNTSLPVGKRTVTTIAPQALLLLNSEFVNERAAALARRVDSEAGPDGRARVGRLFRLALGRDPTPDEAGWAQDYLAQQTDAFAEAPAPLVFGPGVPERVAQRFLDQLDGTHMLIGPREGWTYLEGRWGNRYNETLEADAWQSPAALLDEPVFADGIVRMRIEVTESSSRLGLLLRARADLEEVAGLELRFSPEDETVELLGHVAEASEILATGVARLQAGRDVPVEIELAGATLRLAVDGVPVLSQELPVGVAGAAATGAFGPGRFGVRVVGEAVALHDLVIEAPGDAVAARHAVGPDDPGPADQRALESLCLLVFNLNEFAYVD